MNQRTRTLFKLTVVFTQESQPDQLAGRGSLFLPLEALRAAPFWGEAGPWNLRHPEFIFFAAPFSPEGSQYLGRGRAPTRGLSGAEEDVSVCRSNTLAQRPDLNIHGTKSDLVFQQA